MKKIIVVTVLALVSLVLLCQEQELPPGQPSEQPPVQAPQPQGRDLNGVVLPKAFIHAGKEYPAGKYQFVLGDQDGQPVFYVANAQREPLFEELAIVKGHAAAGSKSHFHVNIAGMQDNEYVRIKVTTQREWFLAYFLVMK